MREERNLNAAESEEVANASGRHTGKKTWLKSDQKKWAFVLLSEQLNISKRLVFFCVLPKIIFT